METGLINTDHDERARERFVLALNGWVQTTLAGGSEQTCVTVALPGLGFPPGPLSDSNRQALRRRMEQEPLHQYWLAMMQIWQDLLWRYLGQSIDRQLPSLVAACRPRPGDRGTLELDTALELPRYQSAVDNHSFPGGYHAETCADDVRQGAIYAQSSNAYLLNRTGARHDYRGQTVIAHLLGRWPDLVANGPCRILDLGCLVGASTLAYAEQFPAAGIHAVDTSAPALRFAHGLAEGRGLADLSRALGGAGQGAGGGGHFPPDQGTELPGPAPAPLSATRRRLRPGEGPEALLPVGAPSGATPTDARLSTG